MQKYLWVVLMVVFTAALMALIIVVQQVSAERESLKSLVAQKQDSLRYLQLKTIGDSLLLYGNDSLALVTFAQADKLFGQSALMSRAQLFIAMRDSLRQVQQDKFATLQRKVQSTLRSLLLREEDLMLRDTQLRTMNQELEHFQTQLSLLQKELEERARSIGKLEFRTPRGSLVYYVGDIKDGKANGYGSGLFSTGGIYVGTWKDNKRHGTGRYTWKDGNIYDGEYENDYRNGFGTYFFTTGEKYVGEWVNDKREGKGTLYDKDGKIWLDGTWQNDEFVR